MKVLLVDNYDSFTWMLRDYLEQCDTVCTVLRNDASELREAIGGCDAVVISPGPSTPAESGRLMELMPLLLRKPLLGVCLGHQAIGLHLGAKLVHAAVPCHGKVCEMSHSDHQMFAGVASAFQATRYHSLLIDELPAELEVTARTASGEVMAFAHTTLPVFGIQFHPESCMTPAGAVILKNFVALAKLC